MLTQEELEAHALSKGLYDQYKEIAELAIGETRTRKLQSDGKDGAGIEMDHAKLFKSKGLKLTSRVPANLKKESGGGVPSGRELATKRLLQLHPDALVELDKIFYNVRLLEAELPLN